MSRTRYLVMLLVLAVSALVMVACGADPAAERPATTPSPAATTASSSPDSEVLFPRRRPEPMPDALMSGGIGNGGKLFLDEKGCLRVKPSPKAPAFVPVWPDGYELDASGEQIRILNRHGKVVAEVGKKVIMGGEPYSKVSLREDKSVLAESESRELVERCPASEYWVVEYGEVHIPPSDDGAEEWPEQVVARVTTGTQGTEFSGYVHEEFLKDEPGSGSGPGEVRDRHLRDVKRRGGAHVAAQEIWQ